MTLLRYIRRAKERKEDVGHGKNWLLFSTCRYLHKYFVKFLEGLLSQGRNSALKGVNYIINRFASFADPPLNALPHGSKILLELERK